MTYLSNWRLRYDPAGAAFDLLAFGQEMESEPVWGPRRGLAVDEVLGGVPILQWTQADVWDIRVTSIHTSANDATARRDAIDKALALGALEIKPLRLTISGVSGAWWQWSSAAIHTPSVRRLTTAPDGGWAVALAITAVGFSKTVF